MSDREWITMASGELPSRRLRCAVLRIAKGAQRGTEIEIERMPFRVGALPSNDLRLEDPAISGHHFEISLEPEGFRIRDLGSRNGTLVGDVRVRDAILPAKATIQVGGTKLEFRATSNTRDVPASRSFRFGGLIGRSVPMRELYAELERIAGSQANVLITGETGTGKEAIAEAIVSSSDRKSAPFVVVDCASLAPTLIESELFGHERGAFTGAVAARAGAFERADRGTVLLDEIGELPSELQPRLLRVLERREVQRLGGSGPKKLDFRVIAATHRSLPEEVNRGAFRADLYYRLSVITVRVPALRERIEDIPLLAEHFLEAIGGSPSVLDADAIARLSAHSWPGNVRELRNAVERLAIGRDAFADSASVPRTSGAAVDIEVPYRVQKERVVGDFERRYAEALLAHSGDNLAKAARKAGLDRMAVVKLLQRLGLR